MTNKRLPALAISVSMLGLVACSDGNNGHIDLPAPEAMDIGRVEISTLPLPAGVSPDSATFTPSGKIMLAYSDASGGPGITQLATLNDDGSEFRPFFAGTIPPVPQSNGIREMLFADGKRIYMGDYVLECTELLEACTDAAIVPVKYPDPLASGPLLTNRWSEMIIAPDNRTVAWTALLSDYSAIVLTGTLEREASRYVIANPYIVSTVERFAPDPNHADGVIPNEPVFNGEVKQFVHGGASISTAGGKERDTTDSTVLRLDTGDVDQITFAPGYDETTIFSPDERLGMVMTTRFSSTTDLAILGYMPRPHPISLGMNLNRFMYRHGVTGVRAGREGNVGPALIDVERSKTEPGYLGENLATEADWVYRSPMSWHPNSKMAAWPEGSVQTGKRRIQIVRLPDYQPGEAIETVDTPIKPGATSDLGAAERYVADGASIDVIVHGDHSGYITYKRVNTSFIVSSIEKRYFDFSDDGETVYNGVETMNQNLGGNSVYTADVTVTGPKPGEMKLKATFGTFAGAASTARLVFDADDSGQPQTGGFVEYDGKRMTFEGLTGE